MTRWLLVGALFTSGCAHVQPVVEPTDPELAALHFFNVSNTTTDAKEKERSDFALVSALRQLDLPFTAFVYATPLVQAGPTHPFHFKAVEMLSEVQLRNRDDFLIPSIINNLPRFYDAWREQLPPEVQANITYHRGRIAHRKSKFEQSIELFNAVPPGSSRYADAQRMLAIALSDERFPHADDAARAKNLAQALAIMETNHDVLQVARVSFEAGRVEQALTSYQQVPMFSAEWNQALFESIPEARTTFACLFVRAGGSLPDFQERYLSLARAITAQNAVSPQESPTEFIELASDPKSTALPAPVLTWLRSHRRLSDTVFMLRQVESERASIPRKERWKQTALPKELLSYLQVNLKTLRLVVAQSTHTTIQNAANAINDFDALLQRIQRDEVKCR